MLLGVAACGSSNEETSLVEAVTVVTSPTAPIGGGNAMTLPARSEVKEDGLPFERALRALKDAGSSLKRFGKTGSVKADPALSESVNVLRRKVKKTRKLARGIARRWFENSTH